MQDGSEPKFDSIKPIQPRPAFAGFVPRAGAFVLDGAVLFMLAWAVNRGFRNALVGLNPALPWLAHAIAFGYFLVGDGPIGRGRSTGKVTLSLHVVTANGGVPGWGASIKRAFLKQLVFFVALNILLYIQVFPATWAYPACVALSVFQIVCLALAVALGVSVSLHPHQRGLHDLWAGTYVTGDPTPEAFREAIATPPDAVAEKRMKMVPRMIVIFAVLATIAMLIRPVTTELKPESRVPFDHALQLDQKAPMPGMRIALAMYPDEGSKAQFAKQVAQIREDAAKRNAAVPTTDSLRQSALYDGETIAVQAIVMRGPLPFEAASSTETLKAADGVRRAAWQYWATAKPFSGEKVPARRFKLLLVEPLKFLVYNKTEWRALIEGPADPAAGPLTVSDPNIKPAAADAPTTATAAATPQPANGPGKPQPTPAPTAAAR
ncbi:MAG: RDD family protein [Candidatus Sumerlaeia bacterium]